jgi:uncharacterized lipoprotein NlpE involved in copper resistance
MNKLILITSFSALIFSLTACSKPNQDEPVLTPKSETSEQITHTAPTESTSSRLVGDVTENTLDWQGEYKGVFPCADCEGIEVELQLNSDKTYELSQEYLGKGNNNETEVKGTFVFDNAEPTVIVLDKHAENRKFFVGENFVEALDTEGKKIESKLNYKLVKKNS